MNDKATILAVDDTPALLAALVQALSAEGYNVRPADSGELALSAVAAQPPDLILLDIRMRGIDGIEVCRRLKAREETRHIPIILASASADAEEWVEGLELGAADYITKPFRTRELLARVKTHLALSRSRAAIEQQASALRQSLHAAERSRRALLSMIEDQKRAEEALRESEARFREFFEQETNYCYRISPDGAILDLNPSALRALGYPSKDEIVGKPLLTTVYAPASRERARQLLLRWRETGVLKDEELTIITRSGEERHVILNASAVRDAEGKLLHSVSVQTDVTEHKQAEAERERLQAQLVQAQKMESVGRLAGGVAHDFNNMLGVILGHTEMALEQVAPAQPLYADLQEIQKAAQRSADLTRQLLAFARRQTVAPKVLDLNETVEGMLKMLQRLIGEDIDLAWLPGKHLGPVRVDPSQIDQILANLCVNARDAIAGVGKVTIETENATFDEAYCAAHAGAVPGEYVLLAVSDNGCGMAPETLSHLFEPFFTTKEVGKGTGLGLATIYGIVKQNNGFIYVYSEPGQGTTFRIYLPRHVARVEQVREEGAAEPAVRGHETILLVEDEPAILKMTVRVLERLGYVVLAASTPGEAIRLARESTRQVHLLMTDVIMPEMNGRELARNLLSLYPHLKRLFMSGYTANVIAHHGVLDPGVHFIQKPFAVQALAAKVREALEGEE